MKFNMESVKGFVKLAAYKLREARPEIALVVGVTSLAAGTVYACVKTKEAIPVIEDLKADNEDQVLAEAAENDERIDIPVRAKLYGSYVWKFMKIYGIPFALWIFGFGCVVGLPKDTNTALVDSKESKLLWAKNKWLLAHTKNEGLVARGAVAGITGENFEIKY